jgi:hypothetical protein
MDRNEHPLEPHHLGVPSGASKTISEPMVRSAKQCIYLASRLALSPNRPKRASTWASAPRSTIRCIEKDLWAYGTFGTDHAPILHQDRPKRFLSLWYVWRKPCTYLALRLTLSPNKLKWHSTWQTSPRRFPTMISERMVHSTQTVHLSCVKVSTISKRNEISIHLHLVT